VASRYGLLVVVSMFIACGGTDRPAGQVGAGPSGAEPAAASVVRTADPVARGLSESDFPRVRQLAAGVYSYEQLRSAGEERFTTVSLFVVTDTGVLVADGQGSMEETQRLIDAIGAVTDKPITHVVICSDHGDHTAGNAAFPDSAIFIAHPTSAAVLAGSASRDGRRPDAPPVVVPTRIVADRLRLTLGGTDIDVMFLGRAHTGGDLVVYIPSAKVLFMSEAFLNRVFPAMRTAYPSEWVAMIERAQAMDVDVFVPGHGFVESPAVLREELETYRQALVRVIGEASRLHGLGVSSDDAVEQASFGDLDEWSLRSSQAATAVRRVYAELDGQLQASGE